MSTFEPICLYCKHFRLDEIGTTQRCDSYPAGIPDKFLEGSVPPSGAGLILLDHFEAEDGDKGIQFELAGRFVGDDYVEELVQIRLKRNKKRRSADA